MSPELDQMCAANQGNRPYLRKLYRDSISSGQIVLPPVAEDEKLVTFLAKSNPAGPAAFQFVALSVAAVNTETRALQSTVPYLGVAMRRELGAVLNRLSSEGSVFVGDDMASDLQGWPSGSRAARQRVKAASVDLAVVAPQSTLPTTDSGNLEQMFYGTLGYVDLVGTQWEVESAREASIPLFPREGEIPVALTLGEAVLQTRGKLMSLFEQYAELAALATPELFERLVGDAGPQLPALVSDHGIRH